MTKKNYKISELAGLLGVTTSAVRKKIKDTPDGKRYKGVYNTFLEVENGREVLVISLSEEELKKEIELAGVNNGCQPLPTVDNESVDVEYERLETVANPDTTPETTPNKGFFANDLIELTKLHEERLATVHNGYCQRIIEIEKQKLLIECSENSTKQTIQALQAENKTVVNRYQRFKTVSLLFIAVLFVIIGLLTFFYIKKISEPPKIIETQKIIEKPVIKYIEKPQTPKRKKK